MIPCPRCPLDQPTECPTAGHLTAHLVNAHLIAAHAALKEAAQVAEQATGAPIITTPDPQPQTKEPPMPVGKYSREESVCGGCGEKGHRSDHCPKAGQGKRTAGCSYCKRTDGTHSKGCRRKGAGGGKRHAKSKPTAKRAVRNGGPPASEPTTTGAKSLLRTHLLQEKSDLEAELKVIDRLLARASG